MGKAAAIAANPQMALAAVTTAAPAIPVYEQHKLRKAAEEAAAIERERLAQLAAQKKPLIPDEDAIAMGRRRSIIEQMRRRGRESTILTDGSGTDPLGA